MKYYIAKVKVHHTDDKGRVKKLTEQYVVNAVSVTDAETKVVKDFLLSVLLVDFRIRIVLFFESNDSVNLTLKVT